MTMQGGARRPAFALHAVAALVLLLAATEGAAPEVLPAMYTGYLDAGTPPSGVGTMYFHYWCVMSQGQPAADPLLFWYNGGPGASSLFGLLQEFGPLLLSERSYDSAYNATGVPTPQPNPWAWTRSHTVCALDSPPPIGMSFCSEHGPGGKATSCGPWSDTTVFAANHAAHRAFFRDAFPELLPNPFYLVGESYAGIYVPGFAGAMLEDPIPGLNFQGFAVGDGFPGCKPRPGRPNDWCVDLDNVGVFQYPNGFPGPLYDIEFFHGHSQFSEALYREIMTPATGCTRGELTGEEPMGARCSALIDEMAAQVGYFYPYDLYDACPHGDAPGSDRHGLNRAGRARRALYRGIAGAVPWAAFLGRFDITEAQGTQGGAPPPDITEAQGTQGGAPPPDITEAQGTKGGAPPPDITEAQGTQGGAPPPDITEAQGTQGGAPPPDITEAQGTQGGAPPPDITEAQGTQGGAPPPSPGDGDGGLGSPCLGDSLPDWLLRPDTLRALGAPPDTAFINLDNGHGFSYTTDSSFVGPIYRRAIKQGLRVLVYEGDSDACGLQTAPIEDIWVPFFEEIGLNMTQRWRPWGNGGGSTALGGYNIDWEGGRVRFASIRGSGHLAPLNRPHASFTLLETFTRGAPLPPLRRHPWGAGGARAGVQPGQGPEEGHASS